MTDALGRTGSRLADRVATAARRVGDFLVPPVCLACHVRLGDHNALCADCWGTIQFIRPPVCDRLGIPLPFDLGGRNVSAAALAAPPVYDRARAVAGYNDAMRTLVHQLKYGDRHDGARLFGRWLRLAGADILAEGELFMPVPLYRWRLFRRRFNQAAILADALSRETGITHDPLSLRRIRRTPSQVGLTADQRRRNVAGAFRLTPEGKRIVAARHIILVDDVITTGATVEACARTLKRAGARRVDVLALARVIDTSTAGV